ncbi:MAG TPA: sulfotransferase [Gammaproteobacteria bacterium]|nr:sulfotransferase [Gammaproteobacteria bacterium]
MKEKIILPRLFILGTQRSGTTLLTRVLSSHPHFYVQNEGMPVRKIFSSTKSVDDIRANINKQFYKIRKSGSINDFLRQKNIDSWGYKDPQLTEYTDSLDLIINASKNKTKFVLIVRDARGVVNSYIDNKWGLGTNAYTGALRWKREVREQLSFMEKHSDLFLIIRFEDLLQDMEASIRAVCEHIDLEYAPSMLEYHQKKPEYKEKRENLNTSKKPDSTIAQKWRKTLSEREINIIEYVAGDELSRLGYEISDKHVSVSGLEKFYYLAHQKIIGEIQLQYRWRKASISDFFDKFGNHGR